MTDAERKLWISRCVNYGGCTEAEARMIYVRASEVGVWHAVAESRGVECMCAKCLPTFQRMASP